MIHNTVAAKSDRRRHAARRLSSTAYTIDRLEARQLLATVPANFVDQSFGTSFSTGTAMAFAPDGRLFALSQGGTVRIIQTNGTTSTAGTVTTTSSGERGLLGIAFDPSFSTNGYMYLYYTTTSGGTHNRVSRFTVSGNTFGSEQILVDLETLSGATNHNGGALGFGPDGKLYVAVGDNANSSNAQSLTSRFGKILRYNPDGTIPADNPTSIAGISGTTSGAYRAIWAAGLRNPYTFAFHPTTGKMFINDVGEVTWEEVNEGAAGRNYGWPATEGYFTPSGSTVNYTPPFYTYVHGSGLQRGYAITGGAFYVSNAANAFPNQYQEKYFFGEYVSDWIGYINPNGPAGIAHSTAPNFASSAGGIVDLDVGPDGALYYLSRDTIGTAAQGVRRIVANFSPNAAIVTQPVSRNAFVGQDVTFFVETTGQSLQYQWQRNGADIPGETSASLTLTNVQLTDSGDTFRVIVRNTLNTVTSNSATLTVAQNNAPVPNILIPQTGTMYSAGQTFIFSGSATDPEDGTLPASALTWQIDFHHDTHTHPFYPATSGILNGNVLIPNSGETAANVWYRVYLTATDSAGRSTTVFRDVYPRTSTITIATSGFLGYGDTTGPAVNLTLDGQPIATGDTAAQRFSVLGVVGIQRAIGAPSTFTANGQTYEFQSWSDGGAASHNIFTPTSDTTYTATYKDVTNPAINAFTFSRDRATPSAPPHSLRFLFSEGVMPQGSSLTLTNQTTGQTVVITTLPATSSDSRTLTYSFAGQFPDGVLPNGRYTATFAANGAKDLAGNVNSNSFVASFNVLAGDVDGDADVDFDDLLILAKNYNTLGKTFAQGNLDSSADGSVNFDDLLVLAKNYNTSLPAAAPASTTKDTATTRKRSTGVAADIIA